MANKPNYKKTATTLKEVTKKHPKYVLQGEVFWCKVYEPDDNKKYTLDLSLDKAGVELMTKYGIPVKNRNDERGSYATFVTYSEDAEGQPIKFDDKVFGADMKVFTGGLIGNRSLVNVEFYPKDWEYMDKSGTSARLVSLQVLKHNKFGGTLLKVEEEYVEAADESSPFANHG